MERTILSSWEDADKEYHEKNGWASCFECDEVFEDLEALKEHQKQHLIDEQVVAI